MAVKSDEAMNSSNIRKTVNQIGQENTFEVKEEPKAEVPSDAPVMAKITTYGVDCYGCYNENGFGGTAGGVKVSLTSVQQSNGSWLEGITYDGYYIVAANSSIPMGSIIEVSNHGFSGYGLAEGQPFLAMVLDRGAMTLNHLDLFVGSQVSNGISINRNYTPTMKIVRYGF